MDTKKFEWTPAEFSASLNCLNNLHRMITPPVRVGDPSQITTSVINLLETCQIMIRFELEKRSTLIPALIAPRVALALDPYGLPVFWNKIQITKTIPITKVEISPTLSNVAVAQMLDVSSLPTGIIDYKQLDGVLNQFQYVFTCVAAQTRGSQELVKYTAERVEYLFRGMIHMVHEKVHRNKTDPRYLAEKIGVGINKYGLKLTSD